MKTFKELTVLDIVDDLPKYRNLVNEQLTLEETKELSSGIADYYINQDKVFTEQQTKNIIDYGLSLDVGPFLFFWNDVSKIYIPIMLKPYLMTREEIRKELGKVCHEKLVAFTLGIREKLKEIVESEPGTALHTKSVEYHSLKNKK